MKSEKGVALITTLVLGLIALVIVGGLIYMLTSGTQISGKEKKYSLALEAAKGASEYIIEKILSGNLTCGGNPCSDGNNIDLGSYSNLGGFNVSAKLLKKINTTTATVFAIEINANSGEERASIDFVYSLSQ
ncbi:hypothetical protein [Hydrogenothermus marinus]|uniref:Uncharacterized protein n=1 Tax=Hydrogenothermus marinus TaxID=133270 RepID=A0A3M0BR90_9AQUI|nr:hypothetical protein [Hydrogenothermus marinus]RMA97015.1 hypothetical protein CLV39_0667 [Hydrogenothermus marinus]